jgi:geranylgeranyl diphosphate synthase, type II
MLTRYLDDCREAVQQEILRILPSDRRHTGGLYELMLDYPLRYGKMLRPALAIGVCGAFGGGLANVLPTAAALELYHNAFLIHDDVEDLSSLRRAEATLHQLHGAATAINVGDAMLAVTMEPLLDNMALIGLGRTLRILRIVARMARESAEGQMLELRWIATADWSQRDADYSRLVHKKTGWYSFLAPVMAGAAVAGLDDRAVGRIGRLFAPLGVAFQIQDDILNLAADHSGYGHSGYGKDACGDLWEGKHTLILIHTLRMADPEERRLALAILRKPHPAAAGQFAVAVERDSRSNAEVRAGAAAKTEKEIAFLRDLILRRGGVDYARRTAARYARRFQQGIRATINPLPASDHRDFLAELADFVINRQL